MNFSSAWTAWTACVGVSLGALSCSGHEKGRVQPLTGAHGRPEDAGTRARVDAASDDGGHLSTAGRQELVATHIDQYFGKANPTAETDAGGSTLYKFDPSDGPLCLKGAPYQAFVRDTGSDDLVIYLEQGGECWTGFCSANETATSANGGTMPHIGLLDDTVATNAVRAWNVVYAPYCDGSVFSGDNDVGQPDGSTIYHRGLRNLSAVLDLAKSKYPNPKRILLAGSSAGGYGTLTATGLVLLRYPDADLMVFNDAGVGLWNPDDPATLDQIKVDWKFDQFIPASSAEHSTGQWTPLIAWGLENDPALRVSAFSSYRDFIIGSVFLKMTAPDFKKLLLEETGKVHDAYPDRFERLMIDGVQHTTLLVDYATNEVDGITAEDFTNAMVNGTSEWRDLLQITDGGHVADGGHVTDGAIDGG